MIYLFTYHKTIASPLINTRLSPTANGTTSKPHNIGSLIENIRTPPLSININTAITAIPETQRKKTIIPNASLPSIVGISSFHFGSITANYNSELFAFQKEFSTMDKSIGTRQTGVSRAWKYEYAEVKMGGKGTGNFNSQQRKELLSTNRVRGAEGHHINNVADHPELQANPDNIKMVADKNAHLKEHHGDFKNETSGPLINRDARLIKTNRIRVIRNELAGIGLAAAIGLGTGFAIDFTITLAQNGLNPNSLKYAFISASKTGGESAILASGSAVLGRTIGVSMSTALTNAFLAHTGNAITKGIAENIAQMCNMGVVGSLTIISLSIYQFAKLKHMGYCTKECLLRIGKSAALSISLLVLSITVQGIWGGPAGIIVSVISGVVITGYTVNKTLHDKKVSEKLTIYTIELCCPIFG